MKKANMFPVKKHIPRPAKISDQPDRHAWENLGWGGVPQFNSMTISHVLDIIWTCLGSDPIHFFASFPANDPTLGEVVTAESAVLQSC